MAPRRVSLFVTCLVDLLYPEVGEATVALLRDQDVLVDFPAAQVCCGQPAFNSGFHDDARKVARSLLAQRQTSQRRRGNTSRPDANRTHNHARIGS